MKAIQPRIHRMRAALSATTALALAGMGIVSAVPAHATQTEPVPAVAKAAAPAGQVSGTTLNWGVKESFRNYVTGRIAQGEITTSEGAEQTANNGVFSFPDGTGVLQDGKGTIAFKGSVNFAGHSGEMDLTLSNLKVELTSATQGKLIADANAPKSSITDAIDLQGATVADLDFAEGVLTENDGTLKLDKAEATLTEEGSEAMASFYEPGDEIDPVSFSGSVAAEESPEASTEHSVKVDSDDGLTVGVTGSNYGDENYPFGVYVAVVPHSLSYDPTPDQSEYLGTKSVSNPGEKFTASPNVAAEDLDRATDYDVLVWPGRSNPSDDNVVYREALNLTAAQKDTLFGTEEETPAPSDEAPSEEPTGDTSPDPSETKEPSKTKKPSDETTKAPSAPKNTMGSNAGISSSTFKVDDATLLWGIKDSFRKYVTGGIANGKITTSGGADQAANNGPLTFSQGAGTLKNGKGTIAFKGTANIKGHNGEMNLTMSNFKVQFTSATEAKLIADAKSPKSSVTDAVNLSGATIADLKFAKNDLSSGDGTLKLDSAAATLTNDGNKAMGGFYEKGTKMDPVFIDGSMNAVKAAAGKANSASGSDNSNNATAGQDQAVEGPSGGSDAQGANGAEVSNDGAGSSGSEEVCRTVKVPGKAGGVSLEWGVKDSFRSYIAGGIAKGKISTGGGAVRTDSGFTWGTGSGELGKDGTGTVSFPGSVHFTGHKGVLDTQLSALRVKVTGSGQAMLIANVKSKDMDGKDLSKDNVEFANISFSGSAENGFNNASVKLTAAGAKVFAGFYEMGQAMDPMSLSIGKATAATTKEVCGDDLAATGFEAGTMLGAAGLLTLAGAALALGVRRKAAQPVRRH